MKKLTDENVQRIKQLLAEGLTQSAIAERMGVSQSTIRDVKRKMREPLLRRCGCTDPSGRECVHQQGAPEWVE